MKFTIALVALLLSAGVFAQTTINAGDVSGTFTKAASPYNIMGDITVPSGSVLTIEPGTQIIFNGAYEFKIKGQIIAKGTKQDSIIFTALDPATLWKAIVFDPFGGTPDDVLSEFEYCRIEYATNYNGGAFYIWGHSNLLINHCTIQHNKGTLSGAIYVKEAKPTISFNTIIHNESTGACSALWLFKSASKVFGNLISNNIGIDDGAVYICETDSIGFSSNVICNNISNQLSAGIFIENCSPILSNNSIVYNHGKGHTGGIYGRNATPNFYNTIVYGNIEGNQFYEYGQVYLSDDFMPNFYNCNIQGGTADFDEGFSSGYTGTATNITITDPLFITPSDTAGLDVKGYESNWGLQGTSTCINGGLADTIGLKISKVDFEGKARVETTIDIGAWELSNAAPLISAINDVNLDDVFTHQITVHFSDVNSGDAHTISLLSDEANVVVQNLSGNTSASTFDIVVSDDWEGSATITVTVTDNSGMSNDASSITFDVNVTSNDAPVIVDIADTSVNEDTELTGSITFSDEDAGNTHTISMVPNSKVKTFAVDAHVSGSNYTINFNDNYYGDVDLALVVTDNSGQTNNSDTTYFTVTVNAINDKPLMANVADFVMRNTSPKSFSVNISDVDVGDVLSANVTCNQANIDVASTTSASKINITLTTLNSWEGSCVLTIELSDTHTSVSQTVNIDVFSSITFVNETISGVWTKDMSPIYIEGKDTIPDNQKLVIEPGVQVLFKPSALLVIQGTLEAIGNASDTIKFSASSTSWKGLLFANGTGAGDIMSDNDSTIFSYCEFSGIVNNEYRYSNGAITINNFHKTKFTHCYFHDNKGPTGGALGYFDSNVTIDRCLFENNVATARGGALGLNNDWGTKAWVYNSVFKNNSSNNEGGAVYSYGNDFYLVNCLIVENSATTEGGAISAIWNDGFFYNNTICNNSAGAKGGALYSYSSIDFVNTVLWGNTAPKGGQFYDDGSNSTFENCLIQNGESIKEVNKCIFTDPMLDAGSYKPSSDSRVANTGTMVVDKVLSLDLAGKIRIVDGAIDIGAYELQQAPANRVPIIEINSEATMMFNSEKNISFTINDPDSTQTHSISVTSNNANILVSGASTQGLEGRFTLNTVNNYYGRDTVIIVVRDNSGSSNDSDTLLVNLEVTRDNYVAISDTISENTTWNFDLIEITNDIVVEEGAVLNIKEGTKISFTGNYRIIVYGNINAIGATDKPIIFTAKDTTGFSTNEFLGWGGISLLNKNNNDTTVFKYCHFIYVNTLTQGDYNQSVIYADNSTRLEVSDCIFKNNISQSTSGIYMRNGASVYINNSVFENNLGQSVSCINSYCDAVVLNSQFINNYTESFGTVYFSGSNVTVGNCFFNENKGDQSYSSGVGLGASTCNINVYNSIFSKNGGASGIIDLYKSNINLVNSTLINNNSHRDDYTIDGRNSRIIIKNSILWNPSQWDEVFYRTSSDTSSLFIRNSVVYNPASYLPGHNIDSANIYKINPDLIDAAALNFGLSNTSVCIDKGTPDTTNLLPFKISGDYYGNPRIFNNTIDIGAIEYKPNSAPSDLTLSKNAIEEGLQAPYFVAKIATIDIDNEDKHTYAFYTPSGETVNNSDFSISNDSLFANISYNYATTKSVKIAIESSDQHNGKTQQIKTINILESLGKMELSDSVITENNVVGKVIGSMSIQSSSNVTYTINDYRVADYLGFEGNNLVAKQAFNYEEVSGFNFIVTATSSVGTETSQFFNVEVKNVYEAPVIIYQSKSINENTVNSCVLSYTIIGEEGENLNAVLISVNGDTQFKGVEIKNDSIIVTDSLDFELDSILVLELQYTDQITTIDTLISISILDVNESPYDISLSANVVGENLPVNTFIGELTGFDSDTNENLQYSITNLSVFTLQGNKLYTNMILDYEVANSLKVAISVSDKGDLSYAKEFTIHIADSNEQPSISNINYNIISENAPGSILCSYTLSDPESQPIYVEILSINDSIDFMGIEIVGNQLIAQDTLDFEQCQNLKITISISDSVNTIYTNLHTSINDVNEAPYELTLSSQGLKENSKVNTYCGYFNVSDPDGVETFTYSLISDTAFTVNGNSLYAQKSFNYEKTDSVPVEVLVTDKGGLSLTKLIYVQITNENEMPGVRFVVHAINENDPGAVFCHYMRTDEETDTVSVGIYTQWNTFYESIVVTDSTIVASEGINHELTDSIEVMLYYTDGYHYKDTTLMLVINDVNEPPLLTFTAQGSYENSKDIRVVSISSAYDEDGDSIQYEIVSVNNDAAFNPFEVDNEGINLIEAMNFEEISNLEINFRYSDGKIATDTIFNIEIYDLIEAPTAIILSNSSIEENNQIGDTVAFITVVDEDVEDEHIISLVDDTYFQVIDSTLLAKIPFDYETMSDYEVGITVEDKGNKYYYEAFIISIIDLIENGIDLTSYGKVKVYPNPVFNSFTLSNIDAEFELLQLYNEQGAIVKELKLTGSKEIQVECSSLSNGVYIIKLYSKHRLIQQKVIKN